MAKIRTGWRPGMERRSADRDGKQVKCLIADAGHVWIHCYDKLPPLIRHRLAESAHNICPACLEGEAQDMAAARRLGRPSVAIYLAVIGSIERQLDEQDGAA
jgi:hypothetical protein